MEISYYVFLYFIHVLQKIKQINVVVFSYNFFQVLGLKGEILYAYETIIK